MNASLLSLEIAVVLLGLGILLLDLWTPAERALVGARAERPRNLAASATNPRARRPRSDGAGRALFAIRHLPFTF